jgi:hypothetical protein
VLTFASLVVVEEEVRAEQPGVVLLAPATSQAL